MKKLIKLCKFDASDENSINNLLYLFNSRDFIIGHAKDDFMRNLLTVAIYDTEESKETRADSRTWRL